MWEDEELEIKALYCAVQVWFMCWKWPGLSGELDRGCWGIWEKGFLVEYLFYSEGLKGDDTEVITTVFIKKQEEEQI